MSDPSRGWRRFERGMNTIRTNPTHAGAKLWRKRVETAQGLDATTLRIWKYRSGYHYMYTCSDFCDAVADPLLSSTRTAEYVDVSDLGPRVVSCFACGRKFNATGVVGPRRVDFTLPKEDNVSTYHYTPPPPPAVEAKVNIRTAVPETTSYWLDVISGMWYREKPDIREIKLDKDAAFMFEHYLADNQRTDFLIVKESIGY